MTLSELEKMFDELVLRQHREIGMAGEVEPTPALKEIKSFLTTTFNEGRKAGLEEANVGGIEIALVGFNEEKKLLAPLLTGSKQMEVNWRLREIDETIKKILADSALSIKTPKV